MANLKRLVYAAAEATALLLFAASPLHAHDGGAVSLTQASTNGASSTSSAASAAKTPSVSEASDMISYNDQKLMKNIAEANIAEIRMGRIALEKSQNSEIRQFAQSMIDDHTKANGELQKLAQSKGVTLPQETDVPHKAAASGLNALSGNTFDKTYINLVGKGDHKRTQQLLQKTQKNAQDPDLRAYAQKTLQSISQHMEKAAAIKQNMQSKNQ